MGFGKLPGGIVRIAADDVDDIADNIPAGCIYENTPMLEHATNEPAAAGAPQVERSLKAGGVRIMSRG